MQRNGLLVPIDGMEPVTATHHLIIPVTSLQNAGTLSDDSGTVLARASAEMVDLNKFN
jgi:hypothetical protein